MGKRKSNRVGSRPTTSGSADVSLSVDQLKHLTDQFMNWFLHERSSRRAEEALIPLTEIGSVIKAARKQQKLNLKLLAALSGVSLGTVQNIEAGKQTISLENASRILGALGKKIWIS